MRLCLVIAPLVFATVAFTACGRTDARTYGQVRPTHQIAADGPLSDEDNPNVPAPPLEIRINSASQGNLYCQQSGECNPSVAMVSIVAKKAIERCTGFLIAPHLLMTNDHCLAHSVAVNERGGNCQNLIFAHFAQAAGASAVSIGCKRVVSRSYQSGLGSVDYAILELDRPVTGRALTRLSNRGFRNGETGTIYRIQMQDSGASGSFDGMQVKTDCRASYGTLVYPMLQSPASPLMTFGDCPIQHGNSGSPVLNERGELAAIIQGYLTPPQKNAALLDELKSVLLDQQYGEVAIATQLACVPTPGHPSSGCGPIPEMFTRFPRAYVEQIGELSSQQLPSLGTSERWRRLNAPVADQRIFISTPVCIAPSARSQSFQSSVLLYQRGINSALLAEWRAFVKPGDKMVEFQADSSVATAPGTLAYSNSEFGTIQVPVCTRYTQR